MDVVALNEKSLWEAYWGNASKPNRDALIVYYQPLVQVIAKYLFRFYGNETSEFDDFVQNGQVGLFDCIDRYDSDFIVEFSTFANYRIKGEILNGISKISEQRSFNAYRKTLRKKRVESIVEESEQQDLESRIGDLIIQLAYSELLDTAFTSGEVLHVSGEAVDMDARPASFVQAGQSDPYHSYSIGRLLELVKSKVDLLPDVEKDVIKMHYLAGLDFREIAEHLNLTKGRISQIHKKVIGNLKKSFDEHTI